MKVLFVGDIYGKSGRLALEKYLPLIKEKYEIDLFILNGENSAHGKGISLKSYNDIKRSGIDFITLGNHFLDNEEVSLLLKKEEDIVRPVNLLGFNEGLGSRVININGIDVRITNVIGKVYINAKKFVISSPFDSVDGLLNRVDEKIHIVDFHGEATGEKKSFAKYFDGRLSAVLGTHTHVQTADNQVFANGTGYISDVGYCGAYDSVLGVKTAHAIAFSKDQDFSKHAPAESSELEFSAVYLDIDNESGKTISIKRIYLTPDNQEIKLLD